MTPHENAERIIQEYPRHTRNVHGRDPKYVAWFKLAVDECRQGHYFYGLDEYFNPLREGYIALTGVNGRGLPLPPPGDSDTQSVYSTPTEATYGRKKRSGSPPLPITLSKNQLFLLTSSFLMDLLSLVVYIFSPNRLVNSSQSIVSPARQAACPHRCPSTCLAP